MEIKTYLPKCERTGKPILEISHSGLNTFSSCPRKWAFRKAILNFNEGRESGVAADVGTALHEGIQAYMRTRSVDDALLKLGEHHPIELPKGTDASVYSLETSIITLLHVMKSGELDNFTLATFIKDGKEVPATEIAFLVEIEMQHVMIHLRGFIDIVTLRHIDNQFMAIDIKTMTDKAVNNLEVKYKYDWQCTSYGIPLRGLLGVDGDFSVGIMGVVQNMRDPQVVMQAYKRNAKDVDEYYFYLLNKCAEIERYWMAQRFPRDPKSCISYGKTCFYFSSCGVSTVPEMQLIVNPSGKAGKPARETKPVFTARLEAHHAPN